MASSSLSRACPPKTAYLVLYNALSAAAWAVVLARTLAAGLARGPPSVYPGVGSWAKWTQTAAATEVLHPMLGAFLFLPPPNTPRRRDRRR